MAGTPLPQAQGLEWKPPPGHPRPLVPAAVALTAAAVDEPPALAKVQAASPPRHARPREEWSLPASSEGWQGPEAVMPTLRAAVEACPFPPTRRWSWPGRRPKARPVLLGPNFKVPPESWTQTPPPSSPRLLPGPEHPPVASRRLLANE